MLGRYQLGQQLEKGSEGVIYRGCHIESGRIVAIKIAGAACSELRLGRELGRFAPRADWTHPNIVQVHESGRAGNARYMVMELAPGADLRSYTSPQNLLPLTHVLAIVARVADALYHAHRHGTVHGDIKPQNILFDPETDTVKIADFPVRAIARGGRANQSLAGTPAYMSPEQVCGYSPRPASDQFSLGITLYRLACGHLPFSASSLPQFAYSIVNEPHADIRARVPALPASLAAVIDRMLAKAPGQRYRNARELARAIRRIEPRAHGGKKTSPAGQSRARALSG
jgi:eukaryotic-like serine/threonine-protein kinase